MSEHDNPVPRLMDRELWACALHMLRSHGDDAPKAIAERVQRLALKGDEAGVATWTEIAHRLDLILAPGGEAH